MVNILNVDYKEFRRKVQYKKIVMWGAGKLLSYYIQYFCKGLDILCIVDSNDEKCNKVIEIDGNVYHILNKTDFLKMNLENVSLFITPTTYASEILDYINSINLLNGVDCYLGILMRDICENIPFEFSKGTQRIPKKIHYCWFGGNEIPDSLKKYMESWYKYCPDYEIVRWDESNYDISKNRYMREAYENKQWGYVPDYARLDIVYNEGGVYLDTDVELLASMDKLLNDEMFCGFSCNYRIAFGLGFGAEKNNDLIKRLRDYYDDKSFYLADGTLNRKVCNEYQDPVLKEFGFSFENRYQKKDGAVVYPSEVLSPESGLIVKNYTKNTVAVHHYSAAWANSKEKIAMERLKEYLFQQNITDA
jgi:hypothetical protein